MRRPGFFVKKEGIIAENARFEGLTRLKDACRVDVCGCLYGRIGFGAFPPRERVPGVFALCRTAASEGWNAWFPLSGGQGCEAPDAGVSGAYRGGGMSGLRVTRTTSRTMCGGRSAPSFGCSVPDRSAVGSSGRCEMLGGFVGQVVCAGIAGPDRCVQPRGSVDCRLPGLPGLSGRSGLSGPCVPDLSGLCQICPACPVVQSCSVFACPAFVSSDSPASPVSLFRPVRSFAAGFSVGPPPFAIRLFVPSGLLCPVRPPLSRPAFSVPPGLFLTPVPSVPPVTPVAVCPATFFILPPLGRSAAGVGRGLQTEGKNLGWGNLGGLSGA